MPTDLTTLNNGDLIAYGQDLNNHATGAVLAEIYNRLSAGNCLDVKGVERPHDAPPNP